MNSNDFYNQVNSSSVQVSKVPIKIDLPNSLIQYPIPSDVPLLVSNYQPRLVEPSNFD